MVRFVAGEHRVPANLGADTPLGAGGLELDSATMLELIVGCEAEFGVTFDPRRDLTPDAMRTVGSLAGSLRRVRGAASAAAMAMMIIYTNLGARVLHIGLARWLERRTQAWRRR